MYYLNMTHNATPQPDSINELQDPSPSKFKKQAIVVAIVLVVLGVIVIFVASAAAGGIIALLGAVFGLGAQVAKDNPIK